MKYHKEKILKHSAWLALYAAIAIGALIGLVYSIANGVGGAGVFISLLMLAYFGFGAYSNAYGLSKVMGEYKAVKDSGLLKVLETIDPYPTYREMLAAVNREKQNKLYEDDEIFITDSFLVSGNFALLLDGILDARVIVHKTNGVTERIELIILYYDGEKTTFDYRRPFGLSGSDAMRECASNLEYALNLIARKSKLFRKYDCCRL